MTQTAIRCGALAALLVLSTACGGSGLTSPTERSGPTAVPAPTPPTFPPVAGPSRIFIFEHELSYRVSEYTKKSRFVLYDSGAFVLQFAICNCGGEYRGRYIEANGVITFEWDGWSAAGPWGASGRLQGDTLTVQYNPIMELTDFENAAYLRTQ